MAAKISIADMKFLIHHTKQKPLPVAWQARWGKRGHGNLCDIKFDEWLCTLVRIAVVVFGPPSKPDPIREEADEAGAAAGGDHLPQPYLDGRLPPPPHAVGRVKGEGQGGGEGDGGEMSPSDCVYALALEMGLGSGMREMHARLLALHRSSRDFDGWIDHSLRATVDKSRCPSLGEQELVGRLRRAR